jgi:MYXO-CTERM domain-containing protein
MRAPDPRLDARTTRSFAWRAFLLLVSICVLAPSCSTPDAPSAKSSSPVASAAAIDLGGVMRRVHFAFRPDADAWTGGHDTYAVRADAQDLRVTPHLAGASPADPLVLSLAGVSRGGMRIDGHANAPTRRGGGLAIPRGAVVEHLQNREEGVEQSFTFTERPAGTGDLVVRVAARGQTFVGATEGGLHFADPIAGLGVRVGQATWIDARGTRTAARVTWSEGEVIVTVAGATVDHSPYPAVLDPLIGPEIEMDMPVPSAGPGTTPAVAYGGGNYLVAWSDYRAIDGGLINDTRIIMASRVSAGGDVLDPTGILVAQPSDTNNGSLKLPSVGWNGTTWMVGWHDFWTDVTACARVSADGVVLDPGGIEIAQSATLPPPAIASDGSNFLVAYSTTAPTHAIYYRRLGADAAWLDPVATMVNSTSNGTPELALAYDGSQYLLVYSHGGSAGAPHMAALRIAPDGTTLDATGIMIAPENATPVVTATSAGWLVAWYSFGAGIRLQRVQSDGTPIDGPSGLLVSPSAQYVSVAVAGGATSDAILWTKGGALFGALVGPTGAPMLTPQPILTNVNNGLAAAGDGTGFLVVVPDTAIQGARLDAALVPIDASPFLISGVPNTQHAPATAFDGTQWLVAWEDDRGTPGGRHIFATRLDANGVVLDPDGISISPSNAYVWRPTVASNGAGWLVAFGVTNGGIAATRVSPTGVVLDPAGITVTPNPALGALGGPQAASNGNEYLVTWPSGSGAMAGRVSGAGDALDPGGFSLGMSAGAPPSVAWNGAHYLVAAVSYNSTSVRYRLVSPDGTVLPSPPLGKDLTSNGLEPSVASDGQGWLAAWSSQTGDILARRVDALGTPLDPSFIAIGHAAAGYYARPRVAWDGHQYWIAWNEVPAHLTDGDAHAARVSPSGVVLDPSSLSVAPDSQNELGVTLASGPPSRVLLAYWGFDPTPGYVGVRVRARILSDPAPGGAACTVSAECASGFCVDGVCCEDACSMPCQACSATKKGGGADGVCGPVAAGTDPDGDCPIDGGAGGSNSSSSSSSSGNGGAGGSVNTSSSSSSSSSSGNGGAGGSVNTSSSSSSSSSGGAGGSVNTSSSSSSSSSSGNGGASSDGGVSDAGALDTAVASGGCACNTTPSPSPPAELLALAALARLRRRRSHRRARHCNQSKFCPPRPPLARSAIGLYRRAASPCPSPPAAPRSRPSRRRSRRWPRPRAGGGTSPEKRPSGSPTAARTARCCSR